VLENGEFYVEDTNSRNGVFVNGQKTPRHKLVSGDQIKIGEAILTFLASGK
jgi:pSer/pThr/pTyr-binding forkhead associated (FHA) protein